MYQAGERTVGEIAELFGISCATVYRTLERASIPATTAPVTVPLSRTPAAVRWPTFTPRSRVLRPRTTRPRHPSGVTGPSRDGTYTFWVMVPLGLR
jgi:hypothetical protein